MSTMRESFTAPIRILRFTLPSGDVVVAIPRGATQQEIRALGRWVSGYGECEPAGDAAGAEYALEIVLERPDRRLSADAALKRVRAAQRDAAEAVVAERRVAETTRTYRPGVSDAARKELAKQGIDV